ncbi:phosphatase [Peptacetobacter hominis]|uniref:Phosphatase n=1 Tax=Peptacetobacter hominis TaxID=2743610 RepID=A0A544QUL4_9FIRM|nr:phosphatase [Peptacetobacter hominis]TQQ84367.1 phosphatase [Peptacetobacter hominis]
MKPLIDLHTHTIVSGHAYSTLKENIEMAKKRGILIYGSSEHAKMMPGTTHEIYFTNFKVVPDEIDGVRILNGIEANIYNINGDIDVDEKLYQKLDYIIASLHSTTFEDQGIEKNTEAVINAIKNPNVKIIGHPDDDRYPLDIDKVAKAAYENKTALEMNNGSLNPKSTRKNGAANIEKMLEACKKYGTMVIMGTDSHICYEVGDFEASLKLLEKVDFPEEQIINFDTDRISYILEK